MLVATSRERLEADEGDLWDSGLINSGQCVNVVYVDRPLRSGQECFWKVRLKDERGELSGWSELARWTMGLLQEDDWKGKWIGTTNVFVRGQGWPPPDNSMPDPWFRKTVVLARSPIRAVAYIASIGYHELYVNGEKVGDAVLVPNAADHKHRARYVTYEIGSLLKPGTNSVGLWLGTSWSIFPHYRTADKPASPIVRGQLEINLGGGEQKRIVTDETWKTHPYGGELYDQNLEIPGWAEADFDDSKWANVIVFTPQLRISADKTEPNRVVQAIQPVGVTEVSNGAYRIDMGRNYAGWFSMDLVGQPGDRVTFQFSERENQPMTHRLHSAYVLGPKGKGTFRNRFNYSSGRWVQVTGLHSKPELSTIRGGLVRTDYARAGSFKCDQPLLNQIYETTLWTFENLSLGSYVVDCPQRERMGYGGDEHATTRTALANYGLGAFYTKWIEDWRDVQGPDGNVPYTSPTYWGGGGPGWSGFCITLPWEIYQQYGDVRILEESFPMMEKWLAFLETKSKNNLLVRWGGEWDFLGDWLWPGAKGVNGDTRETLFFNNCYWIFNLQTAAEIAKVLGNTAAAEKYSARAAEVQAAIHPTFYEAADQSYVNGFPAYLAIALLTDVPPANLREGVWKRLEKEILVNRKGHIHAGITGGAILFKALMENGRDDLIYTMLSKEDYPGWGDMLIRGGATTFFEDWDFRESYLCRPTPLRPLGLDGSIRAHCKKSRPKSTPSVPKLRHNRIQARAGNVFV
jgi:alpha-L-rhamnosidase